MIFLSAMSDFRKRQFYYYNQEPSHRKQYLKYTTLTFYLSNAQLLECYISKCSSFEQFRVEILLIAFSRFLSSWQRGIEFTLYNPLVIGNERFVALVIGANSLGVIWGLTSMHLTTNCWTEIPSSVTPELLLVGLGCSQSFSALNR